MNTIVRSLPNYWGQIELSASPFVNLKDTLKSPLLWLSAVLVIAVFFSALAVVVNQQDNRHLFNQLTSLQKSRNSMYVKWGQLLLEESTWSTQSRIQRIATENLDMVVPKQKNIVIVQQ